MYHYVRNNPLRYIDPTGHACVSDDGGKTWHNDNRGGESCEHVKADKTVYHVYACICTADERAMELAYHVNNLTSNHSLAELFSKSGQAAAYTYGAWKILSSVRGLFGGARVVAGETIPSITGGISRAALEAAAADTGETVTVFTNLTGPPAAGRGLSVAVGEGAEALADAAGAARGAGMTYTAQIPKALLNLLEKSGLAQRSITDMGSAAATEIRIAPQATQFVVKFFN